jgi:hypothetical protein
MEKLTASLPYGLYTGILLRTKLFFMYEVWRKAIRTDEKNRKWLISSKTLFKVIFRHSHRRFVHTFCIALSIAETPL